MRPLGGGVTAISFKQMVKHKAANCESIHTLMAQLLLDSDLVHERENAS